MASTAEIVARREFLNLELTNALAGLNKKGVNGVATSVSGSVSARLNLGNNLYFTPLAGLTWSQSEISDFRVLFTGGGQAFGGNVSPGKDESLLGRISGRLSYVQALSSNLFLIPFADVSYWRNFENVSDVSMTFDALPNTTLDAKTQGVRDFVQFGAGVAVSSTTGVAGYVQGLWREGSDISGAAITAGGRINF